MVVLEMLLYTKESKRHFRATPIMNTCKKTNTTFNKLQLTIDLNKE